MAQQRESNGSGGARVFHHNEDAEASILGGILLQPSVLELLEDLEVDDFFNPRNKIVFQAMRNLASAARAIDVVTVESEIARAGKLDAVGGAAYLGECALRVPTKDNVEHYKHIVKTHARNRAAKLALSSALHRLENWPHDPLELIGEVAGELARLDQERERHAAEQKARWIVPLDRFLGDEEPSDDDSADWLIRDLVPRGEPCLWAGPQKAGKTWAALDLALAIALGESWLGKFDNTYGGPARVLCIFLEDNQRRLRKRLWELARGRFKTPNDPVLREHLCISRTPLRLPDAQDQRRLAAELKQWKPAVVLLDNLTRVMVGDPNSTREAAMFTRAWAELGEDAGCTVEFLHHTKKPFGDQREQDPFDQIRGSGDFGATARNIIVSRPLPSETEKLAEVRMRGNLDLRRESFVLGFERLPSPLGKMMARLTDRGDVAEVREQSKKQRADDKDVEKQKKAEEQYQKRKNAALELARKHGGFVTQKQLAAMLGFASERTFAPVFERMVLERLLEQAGKRGYMLPGTSLQGGLL